MSRPLRHEHDDTHRVGVSDFVLLTDLTEQAVVENLKKRFDHNEIYTSIVDVLVAVNPYKSLPIYGEEITKEYKGSPMYDYPPHIFTIADSAYRNMTERNENQCIIISGESGAGKTESSKYVMKYIAAVSGNSIKVDKIKEQLLNSNPILEAFGNAKTQRNDNSSRFGKYMDLQFDFKGDPVGGSISTYLLEKIRVVQQGPGERNFHIFYQLLAGADDNLRRQLNLTSNIKDYAYLKHSTDYPENVDKTNYKELCTALKSLAFPAEKVNDIFQGIAAILHLGNVTFKPTADNGSSIASSTPLQHAAAALGVDKDTLAHILTTKSVREFGRAKSTDSIQMQLSPEKATRSRDALAKALFGRLFLHIVDLINERLKHDDKSSVIGVLDIYGFEIFPRNGYEQFCINYCNEKLQQVFIELTLKSEQEEYHREGIAWTPVQYFNNNIICDLIESRNKGIITLLDDECLRPGDVTDLTFLSKLNEHIMKHPHYDSREKTKSDKRFTPNNFSLKHYAGDVVYTVDGFIDSNMDTLNRDALYALHTSTQEMMRTLFPENPDDGNNKRPETSGTQFRASIQKLMANLLSKSPHYVRCIKSNGEKKPGAFDSAIVEHQIRYLGILENIRVRRAGFCYRQLYEKFVQFYKTSSKRTFPFPPKDHRQAIKIIMDDAKVDPAAYQFGETKLFIKDPESVFALERARKEGKNRMAVYIQKTWRRYIQRKRYLAIRQQIIKLQSMARMFIEKMRYKAEVRKVVLVQTMVKGYLARKRYLYLKKRQPKVAAAFILRVWRNFVINRFLTKSVMYAVHDALGRWRQVKWPMPPYQCREISAPLKEMYRKTQIMAYRRQLSPERKAYLELKVVAETLFRQKANYRSSIPMEFTGDYVTEKFPMFQEEWKKACPENKPIIAAVAGSKYHRRNPRKNVPRIMILTDTDLYTLDGIKFQLKEKIDLKRIRGFTSCLDGYGFFVLHTQAEQKNEKADAIYVEPNVIEFLSRLYMAVQKHDNGRTLNTQLSNQFEMKVGKKTLMVSVEAPVRVDAKSEFDIRQVKQTIHITLPKTNLFQ